MAISPAENARKALALCRQLGFAAAGVTAISPTRWGDELIAWLEAGRHGSMAYLKEHLELRLDPASLLPGACSMILVADLYTSRGQSNDPPPPSGHGRIARYARGRDYHKVIKIRLFKLADALRAQYPDENFRAFVDTAPILEREYAARAGIGWIAKNTLLIHPKLGSYTLLGGMLTTLPMKEPPEQLAVMDHCGICTRCVDACPTQAISPYSVDATRCISYLTIERRDPIPPDFHDRIGDWLYGCDICQEVCPHNSPRPDSIDTGHPHPDYTPTAFPRHRSTLPLLDVLSWDPNARSRAFEGSAMKRARLDMMKRNALIVAGNMLGRAEDPPLRQRIEELAADQTESEMVRETAAVTLERIARSQPPHSP